jgi:hypothetical protein
MKKLVKKLTEDDLLNNNKDDAIKLYLDVLSVYKTLIDKRSNTPMDTCENDLIKYCINYLNENRHLVPKILCDAIEQDLTFINYVSSGNCRTLRRLTLDCFLENDYVVETLLDYVGNIPLNICIGNSTNILGTLKLEDLKSIITKRYNVYL